MLTRSNKSRRQREYIDGFDPLWTAMRIRSVFLSTYRAPYDRFSINIAEGDAENRWLDNLAYRPRE